MKWTWILSLLFFVSCASEVADVHPSGLVITEINPNKWTAITKQNLLHLTQVYDLAPLLYTKTIHLQSKVIPHSHPVLTLNTRYAEHPNKILSAFLHEEFHWWLSSRSQETEMAIKELKKVYIQIPKMKKTSPHSIYLHLIVCDLELRALTHFLGRKEARGIIYSIMKKDKIYPWIYHQVLYKEKAIEKILKRHQLIPPPIT